MRQSGLLIVISGPSGAGKGTLCKALLERINNLEYSVSATTRQPRNGEIDGENYYFITEEDFMQRIKQKDFLEWAKVYDNYYGTPKKPVLEKLKAGKDVILEIDIQGAMKVKKKFPEGVFIFIAPPSIKELKMRICKRGTETEEAMLKRVKSAYDELKHISEYDYVVVNDVLDKAVNKLMAIIIAEKCRVKRNLGYYFNIQQEGEI